MKRLKLCLVSGPIAAGEKERSCPLTDHSVNNPSDEKTSVLVKSIETTIRINCEKVKIDSQESKV